MDNAAAKDGQNPTGPPKANKNAPSKPITKPGTSGQDLADGDKSRPAPSQPGTKEQSSAKGDHKDENENETANVPGPPEEGPPAEGPANAAGAGQQPKRTGTTKSSAASKTKDGGKPGSSASGPLANVIQPGTLQRILQLCQKGEWPAVELALKGLEKAAQTAGAPPVTFAGIADEVGGSLCSLGKWVNWSLMTRNLVNNQAHPQRAGKRANDQA